ncbi:hypothetical protein ECTPHS_04368 [Ectothiorhodospira sp. PHS-1]|nr:hypothetical protein ECTPHS_04368 [Ectothiorhodospira sp. PHS-1]
MLFRGSIAVCQHSEMTLVSRNIIRPSAVLLDPNGPVTTIVTTAPGVCANIMHELSTTCSLNCVFWAPHAPVFLYRVAFLPIDQRSKITP